MRFVIQRARGVVVSRSRAVFGVKMHFSAISCLVLVAVAAAQYTEEDDVLVLTKDTFSQAVADFKLLLVEFCKSVYDVQDIWLIKEHM